MHIWLPKFQKPYRILLDFSDVVHDDMMRCRKTDNFMSGNNVAVIKVGDLLPCNFKKEASFATSDEF